MSDMHLHVLLPGAFWPGKDSAEATRGLSLDALETLIARGHREAGPGCGPERWLLERFGIERQRDWPAAPYSLMGDGGEAGETVWMRADPVHLRAGRDNVVLEDASRFDITRAEAESLAGSISLHFAGRFSAIAQHAQRWYLRLRANPDIETDPIMQASGEAIDAHLPRGADGLRWQALANELQMLMHEHPVNLAREARGELPVNGIWMWGAGCLAAPLVRPFLLVAAEDPLARGLARASGAESTRLPAGALAFLDAAGDEGEVLLVLDALRAPFAYADAPDWRERLESIERDWIGPLAHALRRGRIGMLSLHLPGAGRSLGVETTSADLRRFWRRVKPLAAWCGSTAGDRPN